MLAVPFKSIEDAYTTEIYQDAAIGVQVIG